MSNYENTKVMVIDVIVVADVFNMRNTFSVGV